MKDIFEKIKFALMTVVIIILGLVILIPNLYMIWTILKGLAALFPIGPN